jgi:very-short-patch-repair endonuclease
MCKDLLLILEADSLFHETEEQKAYDEKRTKDLEEKGFCILRFTNSEIQSWREDVETKIRTWIRMKTGMSD